jgi:hypothetical protein
VFQEWSAVAIWDSRRARARKVFAKMAGLGMSHAFNGWLRVATHGVHLRARLRKVYDRSDSTRAVETFSCALV